MPSFSPWSKITDKIRFRLETPKIRTGEEDDIEKKKTKREGMFVMTEDNGSKVGPKKPEELTIYKPEDQIYQKLHLCDYLRELYEAAEKENEPATEKKKDFQRHPPKEPE